MDWRWVVLGIVYVALLILGIIGLRKGHWMMFIVGFFIPLFWITAALLPPEVQQPRRQRRRNRALAVKRVLHALERSLGPPT
jgi:hypothetical protein